MKVLSLFDGISWGRVALERGGVLIDSYDAYEIEPWAIKISEKNYPDINHHGDVTKEDFTKYKGYDLLIGGSPCQGFSDAGKRLNFQDERSRLFFAYVRALKEAEPKYFLLENVRMKKEWVKVISDYLGVEPIEIDSALVSAQSRRRLYWPNIPNVTAPQDKHIYIDDIIQHGAEYKYLPRTRLDYDNYDKSKVDRTVFKNMAIEIGCSKKSTNGGRSNGKAYALRRICPNGVLDENDNIRFFTPVEAERLQTLPDNYTLVDGIRDRQRYAVLGNGWTVDVIAHILKNLKGL